MTVSRLLLDTHVFIWWRAEPSRLEVAARRTIAEAEVVFVSAASAWEVGIKVALGRLRLPETMEAGVEASGFERLGIGFSHCERAAALPLHHRDPFDRMLIAQALVENLTLVTHDRQIEPYRLAVLWA